MNGNGHGHGSDDIRFDKRADLLISFAPAPERPPEAPSESLPDAKEATDMMPAHPELDSAIPSVFGESRRTNSTTVIPVSSVLRITRPSANADAKEAVIFSLTSPVALIEAREAGVTIKLVLNTGLLVVCGTFLTAWNFYWLFRTLRERAIHDGTKH